MDSTVSSYPVHLGFWVNKAHGQVFGSTLTITRSDGALLIAFIAFFVTLVGTQVWRILCFVLFEIFSKATSQDALHNQRQAILRNSASPFSGTRLMIQMLHAWVASNPRARPLKRILPMLLGSLIVTIALTAASGLSSQIARGNEVLIDGSKCGIIKPLSFISDLSKLQTLYSPYATRQFERGSEYAQRCYESDSSPEGCDTFIRKALPMTITRNASCPFDKPLCRSQDSNLVLDTGLMDSQTHFGLNLPETSRFQMRHRLHCAPLNTEQFKSKYTWKNKTLTAYKYGDASQPTDCNCTMALDADTLDPLFGTEMPTTQPNHDYSLQSFYTAFSNGSLVEPDPEYIPLSGLSKHGGDLYLNFLFPGSMVFTEESKDDWYKATTPISITSTNNKGKVNYTMYMADEPAWPMGCVEQCEVCKQGTCTGIGTDMDVVDVVNNTLHMSSDFLGEGSYIRYIGPLSNVLKLLGKSSLASRYKAGNSISTAMKANEWHLDVIHWESTMLASLQYHLAEIASGPVFDDPEIEQFITRPNETERKQYCDNQIIRSTAYTSFSVFGLFFVAVLGVLIIFVSLTVERLAAWIEARKGGYASLEWRASQALQLHRLAHEDVSKAEWRVGYWDIPVAVNDSTLAIYEAADRKDLPRLQRPADYALSEQSVSNAMTDSEISSENASPHIGFVEKKPVIT